MGVLFNFKVVYFYNFLPHSKVSSGYLYSAWSFVVQIGVRQKITKTIIITRKVRSFSKIYCYSFPRNTLRCFLLCVETSPKLHGNKISVKSQFLWGEIFAAKMASVKWLLLAFWEVYSFTLCCGKYFTLVFGNTDKRSSTMPIGVYPAQTTLHCAALCDTVPSCYSFTFSKTSLGDNCRLLPSTATTSTFTLSDVGSKHFARKVDCKWRFLYSWLVTQKCFSWNVMILKISVLYVL